MTPPQQQFYDSLEDEEKLIINVALFIAGNVTSRAISQHITPFSKKYISDAKIKKALAAAAKAGFFVQTLFYREEYCAKTDVLIAYFPKLERYKAIKANLKPDPMRFWYDKASDFAEQLRDMLYALLFQQKEYPDAENEFCYKYDEDNVLRVYFQIVNNTDYASVIRYINTDMLEYICGIRVIRSLEDLESPTVIEQQINYFRELCKSSTTFENERVILKYIQNIRKGIFHQNIELEGINLCDPLFLDMALRSEPLKAVKLAEQNLKVLKKTGPNNFPFYVSNTDVYYYILTLLQTDSKTYIPILDRVIKWKNKYADKEIALPFQAQFYAIISDVALQDKTQNNSYIAEIPKSITDGSRPIMLRLYNTLIYYVLGKSLGNNQYDTLTKLMQRTLEGEDYLAAYELAYVMHQWYNNADTKKRLNDLSAQFDFTPMISRINIVSEWEKTLNLLLSMEKGTKQKAVTNEKNKRVAYALNPNNLTLQPVLQSKQAKGWSNGRNIALPTFIKGDVEG
ncbi:MAG: hypothetical protein LBM62_00435, partial [Mediterranea sp.]|nr:hypothetical protein [Mediterranea sp.]